jgi:hypothetical protein
VDSEHEIAVDADVDLDRFATSVLAVIISAVGSR